MSWSRWASRLEAYMDYLCLANLAPSRFLNAFRYAWGKGRSRDGRLRFAPPFYMVETGEWCRLRCRFCCQRAYEEQLHSPRTMLRLAALERMLDKIAPFALVLDLFKHGEPFLNPEIESLIAAAARRGIRVRVNSNLNFALDSRRAESILNSGLYKLTCAIDGTTQAAYERYRVGGDLELALHNASLLIEAKRKAKRRHPILIYRMLVFEWNHHQVEEARSVARRMGFDRFAADPGMHFVDGKPAIWDLEARRWRPQPWHVESVAPGHTNGPLPPAGRRCPSLFSTMVLHAGGDSMVCCHSNRREWQHDNLLAQSLDEVWNSELYVRTRRASLGLEPDRDRVFPQCRSCCWL